MKTFLGRIPFLKPVYHFFRKIYNRLPLKPDLKLGRLYQHPPYPIRLPIQYFHTLPLQGPVPKISIVTPSYNYGDYIETTVRSVFQQDYPNLEYILQDGGSSDTTLKRLEKFREKFHHFESAPDSGQAQAINKGFQHATGDILAYLNADDFLCPFTLQYVANYFAVHPDVDVVYGYRLIVDKNDQVVGEWVMPSHDDEMLRWADYIPQETLFWRRRIWEKVGGRLDESFHFAMDWDLLLRFQRAGAVMHCLPRFLGAFRVHERQKTSTQQDSIGEVEVNRLRAQALGKAVSPAELWEKIRPFLYRAWFSHHIHMLQVNKLLGVHPIQQFKDWYPPESVYFFSVFKAGTSLFTHVLRHADELTHVDYETLIFDNQAPDSFSFETYGKLYGVIRVNDLVDTHPAIQPGLSSPEFIRDKNTVVLIRDPRDILVSAYYSFGFTHVESKNPSIQKRLDRNRELIRHETIDECVIRLAPEYLANMEKLYQVSCHSKRATILKYEDLIENFDRFIRDFDVCISIPEERKKELYLASRPNEKEDPTIHKRSGKVGQYSYKLKPETIQVLNQILRPVLEHFNYPLE